MSSHISGFLEFLPKEQILFNKIIDLIRLKFESYGFIPLETSAVERAETLLSKGNDNEIYGIYRLAEEDVISAKKDMGLRFDLTVPLARYVAKNYGQLVFPYRRYQIAPVWRGERPQSGRYRQFYQCDIDIINEGELSDSFDAELVAIVYDIFTAINLKKFTIKINNRKILTGLMKSYGVNDPAEAIKVIDKFAKISKDQFISELSVLSLTQDQIEQLVNLISLEMNNDDMINYLVNFCNDDEFLLGVTELRFLLERVRAFGVDENNIKITPALARGLNYYTGTIYETQLDEYPSFGSIAGGGRYANLVSGFGNKSLPGVGLSIGITRLFPKLIEMGVLKTGEESIAPIIITSQNHDLLSNYIIIAKKLRDFGFFVELYLQEKALANQLKYASKKGFKFALIADKVELERGEVIVKDMLASSQEIVKIDDLCNFFLKKGLK